jgi:hypothetical protein
METAITRFRLTEKPERSASWRDAVSRKHCRSTRASKFKHSACVQKRVARRLVSNGTSLSAGQDRLKPQRAWVSGYARPACSRRGSSMRDMRMTRETLLLGISLVWCAVLVSGFVYLLLKA